MLILARVVEHALHRGRPAQFWMRMLARPAERRHWLPLPLWWLDLILRLSAGHRAFKRLP